MSSSNRIYELTKSLNSWDIFIAGVSLVVAATTLVSDLTGYFTFGIGFAIALAIAFVINLFLTLSAADLGAAYPRAGWLYDYAKAIFKGQLGKFLGVFLGLAFFGTIALASSAEIAAGAFGLQALFRSDLHLNFFIIAFNLLSVFPNIFGLKIVSWLNAFLLVLLLGIRWMFGIVGFLGLGATGTWSFANLTPAVSLSWFGAGGIITGGIALAFWSFIGMEFVCSLAEEVDQPRKALPRGMLLGLLVILATSLVMGFGITGTQPLSAWQALLTSEAACGGSCPQLAVGKAMFGEMGYILMAFVTVIAAWGTMVVAYGAMPRIIYSVARDRGFFGSLSDPFSKLHPRYGTPVLATLFTFFVYIVPALHSAEVVKWGYSATYVWAILYVVFHILALLNRRLRPEASQAFSGKWFQLISGAGIVLTVLSIYYAFAGRHVEFGGRALLVILVALGSATLSLAVSPQSRSLSK